MPESSVKFVRTLHNQLIIGKVLELNDTIDVVSPYSVQPTPQGLDLQPLDKDILGKEIKEITLYKSNLIYIADPGQELKNTYLSAISGIELDDKKLILG